MSYSSRGDGNSDPHVGQDRRRPGQNMERIQLSEADIGVLAECRYESFYYRSLPIASLAAITTHQLIRMGYLTTGRFGQAPKIIFAIFTGYLAGKLSYVEQCKKKFMKLQNSEIGEMLRKGKNVSPGTFGGLPSQMVQDAGNPDDQYDQLNMRPSDDPHVNLDIDTSHLPSMDDKMDRPETLQQFDDLNQSMIPPPKPMTTYEELRKKNREQNTSTHGRMVDSFAKQPVTSERGASKQSTKGFEGTGFSKSVNSKVNTYGDTWDE